VLEVGPRYAEQLRERTTMPLMLTGGIRTRAFMNDVLASGAVDILGLARPFAVQPDVAARLLDGAEEVPDAQTPRIGLRFATPLNAYLQLAWHAAHFRRIAAGHAEPSGAGAVRTLAEAGTRVTVRAMTTV
jgi:hypothetical protein